MPRGRHARRHSVVLAGTELADLGDKELTELRRDKVGFIFQSFNLLPVLTAEENILLPPSIAGRKPDQPCVDRLIEAVGLCERLGGRPAELSGGQQQRVAVARALASRPAVVFADEPTANLDSKTSAEVMELLRRSLFAGLDESPAAVRRSGRRRDVPRRGAALAAPGGPDRLRGGAPDRRRDRRGAARPRPCSRIRTASRRSPPLRPSAWPSLTASSASRRCASSTRASTPRRPASAGST